MCYFLDLKTKFFVFILLNFFIFSYQKKIQFLSIISFYYSNFFDNRYNIWSICNNLDLLNRSPGTIASYFEIRNYFSILLKYFIKNPILILLIFFVHQFFKKMLEKEFLFS